MDEKNKVVNIEFKNNQLVAGVDTDRDGEKSIDLKLSLGEAFQEAVARGEVKVGAKVVDIKFELTKLRITVDSDKDGEKLLEIVIDLGEAFEEVSGAISKK